MPRHSENSELYDRSRRRSNDYTVSRNVRRESGRTYNLGRDRRSRSRSCERRRDYDTRHRMKSLSEDRLRPSGRREKRAPDFGCRDLSRVQHRHGDRADTDRRGRKGYAQSEEGSSVIASSVTDSERSDFKQVAADTGLQVANQDPSGIPMTKERAHQVQSHSAELRSNVRGSRPGPPATLMKTGNLRADKFIRLLGHGRAKSTEKDKKNLNALLTGGGNQVVNQMQHDLEIQYIASRNRNISSRGGLGLR